MKRGLIRGVPGRRKRTAGLVVSAAVLLVAVFGGLASAERSQYGQVVVWLDGGLSPLRLPRSHPAPVSLSIDGGLQTSDRSALPHVQKVEFAVPGQAAISTRGLPRCSPAQLHGADVDTALDVCGNALVGRGALDAQVVLPSQAPFWIKAKLLLFNANPRQGKKALLMYGYVANPPIWVVLPFLIHRDKGWLGIKLIANVPQYLGPWPRFARFELRLSRRYFAGGKERSFLSASCPLPPLLPAGSFTLTRVTYTLAGGQQVSRDITRGCRAR